VSDPALLARLRAIAQSRYDLDREDGALGPFTRVLARDRERLGAAVVLQVADAGGAGAPSLGRIARAAALRHPHVLEITDHGEAAGFVFYATPVPAGVTLRTWLSRETRLPILEAVRVLRETALASARARARRRPRRAPAGARALDRHARARRRLLVRGRRRAPRRRRARDRPDRLRGARRPPVRRGGGTARRASRS
jgi:hypothetical protein